MSGPRSEYGLRIARWGDVIARGERTHLTVSNLRLAIAAAAALIAWLAFIAEAISAWSILAPALGFLALVVVHARVLQRNERATRARRLYERGLERLEGRWMHSGPDGSRFLAGHRYAHDLDLFGPASLFQLLHTVRTEAGEETLAAWLGAPAPIDEVRARQGAVTELGGLVDFREDLAVLAAEAHVGRTTALASWASAAPAGLTRTAAIVLALLAAVGVAVAAKLLLTLYAFTTGAGPDVSPPLSPVVGWFLLEAAIVGIWRQQVNQALLGLDEAAYDLKLFTDLVRRIEREPFTSPLLVGLHATLVRGSVPASRHVERLLRLVAVLDSFSLNLLFIPFGRLFLARSQIAVAIDRWRAAHGRSLAEWLQAVGELEALASLATYSYEHPADPFPALTSAPVPRFDADRVAHPLMVEAASVPNDVRLGGDAPQVLIVSGSNMSGKSTLLRAVGMNVVLALAGGPVRAARVVMSPLVIGATLRIEDSLQEGYSRFYAEILRIRAIVELARSRQPVLFLLDEILHGTNSYDRRIGAEGIVRALVGAGTIGLVTTHDLALTELATALGTKAANVHFEDRIEAGRMVFDYRMRPGIVERSNALALMRAVGLEV